MKNLLVTSVAAVSLTVAASANAASPFNLTSMGLDTNGNSVWRIRNSSNSDGYFKLWQYGGSAEGNYIVAAGEDRIVILGQGGTFKLDNLTDNSNTTKTKASGSHDYNPPEPVPGPDYVTHPELDDDQQKQISQFESSQSVQDDAIGKNSSSIGDLYSQVEAHGQAYAELDSRLNQHGQAIDRNTQAIGELQSDVAGIREDVTDLKAGVAGAYAAASHQFYLGSDAGGQMSLAGGYYEGESAASLAIGAPINETTFVNANITHDSRGNTGMGVGVTFKLW